VSVFDWKNGQPSGFAKDRRFRAQGKTGLSMSLIGSRTVDRRTKAEGKSPGTIDGIARSAKSKDRKPAAWAIKSGCK
jgi:hypothetical protein